MGTVLSMCRIQAHSLYKYQCHQCFLDVNSIIISLNKTMLIPNFVFSACRKSNNVNTLNQSYKWPPTHFCARSESKHRSYKILIP